MLNAGTRLGPFEIVAPLGAGGMGEVYRAHDTRLGREVAIKVLPADFASDPERLRRFEQEARAASALNHPNIVVVFDVGTAVVSLRGAEAIPPDTPGPPRPLRGLAVTEAMEEVEVHYLVEELLEGESLRERLKGGALPPRKAVEIAVQACSGLAAAHEKGIIHRDLKPENLFVTSDGHVKILDFGVAKLKQERPEIALAPTVVDTTAPGMVIGTVAYMSPEQVRGLPVDQRSDIFSLGCVLYEMLTGKRAFVGDSSVETMNAILKEEPPEVSAVQPGVPPPLAHVVNHCLEKRPEERFQSARDLAFDLGLLSGISAPQRALAETARQAAWRRWAVLGAGAAGLAGTLALGIALGRHTVRQAVPSFSKVTFRQGYAGTARFAADGETIVYFASWDDAPERLYLKRPDAPDALPLELPGAFNFAVSKQGEVALVVPVTPGLGPLSAGVLARAPLAGGAPREIVTSVSAAEWTPEGSDLAVVRNQGGRRRLEFPLGKVLYETAGHVSAPRFSPDGKLIAFLNHPYPYDDRGSVAVVDRAGNFKDLTEEYNSVSGLAWSPLGDEIWFAATAPRFSRSLYAVTTSGRLRPLLRAPGNLVLHDVSPNGRVLVAREDMHYGILVGTVGEPRERDLSWLGGNFPSDISADGKEVLFTEGSSLFGADYAVCLRRTDGSPPVVLGKGYAYALSPDGAWALASLPSPEAPLQLLPTGPGEAREIKLPGLSHHVATFFPDGRSILVEAYEKGHRLRLYRVELDGGRPQPVTPEGLLGSEGSNFAISPDGKWIAVTVVGPGIWLYSLEGGERRELPTVAEPSFPIRWSADGTAVLIAELGNPGRIIRIDVASGTRVVVKELKPADPHAFPWFFAAITPDERTYAYQYVRATSELYLVEDLR